MRSDDYETNLTDFVWDPYNDTNIKADHELFDKHFA